ncbi:MAG TPA: Calx-beta domain-containing protein [Mycobacterium sp.]|nr:Calx-beta domain-containing protein [Mycobacterium sp.]
MRPSIFSSRSQFCAVVLILAAALSLGLATPALAQFVQGDLTGNWTMHGLTTANFEQDPGPANWFRGSFTLSSTGVVLSGAIELADGSTRVLIGGKLTIGPTGLVGGTLNVAGSVVNVRATMTPDKNGVVGVADDAAHARDEVFALVRQTATTFSTTELMGQWIVYGISTPEDGLAAAAIARGALTFNELGALQATEQQPALLNTRGGDITDGVDQLTGGELTVSSAGVVAGSLNGNTGGPTPEDITYTISGVIEAGGDVIVGVATREVVATGAKGRIFFVAMKSGAAPLAIAAAPAVIGDVAGTWRSYIHIVINDDPRFGLWLEGLVVIRGTDGFVSGTLRNADGTTGALAGTLTTRPDGDPATRLSGDLLLRLSVPGFVPFVLPAKFQGGVSPAHDRIFSSIFINVAVPPASLTIHGLAMLVHQPVSTVQFAAPTYTVREQIGGSTALISVTRSGTVGVVSVDWATVPGGTATPGVDYTAATGTVTFPNGVATVTFPIAIADDNVLEPNKTVNLVLRDPTNGAVIGPRSTAQLIIQDDEQIVQFHAASANITVNEGVPSVTLTLTRTGPSATAFTVPVVIDGGTAVSNVDYPASLDSGLVVAFAPGQLSKTVSVPLLDDVLLDGVKTLVLRLGTPSSPNVLLGVQQTSTITIVDNESGSVRFAVAASSIVEGGLAKITVIRTGTNLQAGIDITYTVTGGTATSDDYTVCLALPTPAAPCQAVVGTGTLSFARGQTTQTIFVQTTADTLNEPSETVIIQLGNAQNLAVLTAPTTHTLTILDNDRPGVLRFTTSALTVAEPQGADRTVQLTVTRAVTLPAGVNFASGVTVDYAVTAGNATSGEDFTLLGTGTLTFDAFQASQTISLVIHPDDVPEGTETLTVTLSNPTGGATLGTPSAITITITDDERAVFFASDRVTVVEATLSVAITLLRSGPPAGGFTIPINIAPASTAVAGQDYPGTFTGATARFASNQMSAVVVIPLLNDAFLDGSKELVLELGTPVPIAPAPDAPAVGTRRLMTIALGDNDTPGEIGFVALASTVNEGAKLRITVGRRGVNLARDVTVKYRVATTPAPTATEGTDFQFVDAAGTPLPGTPPITGTLTFGPGATSAFIDVKALLDGIKEPTESFTIELFENSHGALINGRTRHVVTINDTNQAGVIQWSPAVVTANEESGAVTLTIIRTGTNLSQDVSVSYRLDAPNAGTATPSADYSSPLGTVTFAAGQTTQTVTLTPFNDNLTEPTETIRILLHDPTGGATLGLNKVVIVNLVDGAERFNGQYSGTFTGSFEFGGPVSGTERFSVSNAVITVSQICGGGVCDNAITNSTGDVFFNGDVTFTFGSLVVGDSTCAFTGRFTPSGTAVSAAGTWTCSSVEDGQGNGTWRATRTSLVVPAP